MDDFVLYSGEKYYEPHLWRMMRNIARNGFTVTITVAQCNWLSVERLRGDYRVVITPLEYSFGGDVLIDLRGPDPWLTMIGAVRQLNEYLEDTTKRLRLPHEVIRPSKSPLQPQDQSSILPDSQGTTKGNVP